MTNCTKVVIAGFYGHGNFGDEIILDSITKDLIEKVSRIEVVIFSRNPSSTSRRRSNEKMLRWSDHMIGRMRCLLELASSDLFILGGGGLVQDNGRKASSLRAYMNMMKVAQELKVPTMAYSIGVGKVLLEENKRLIGRILNKADIITVRDDHSAQQLSRLGVTRQIFVTADASVQSMYREGSTRACYHSQNLTIGVNARNLWECHLGTRTMDEIESSLADACDYLVSVLGANIIFVPFESVSKRNDALILSRIRGKMKFRKKSRLISHAPSMPELLSILMKCDVLIGMRLHSLVAAACVSLPMIGLAYDSKVSVFMNSINQGGYVLSIKEISKDRLVGLVKSVLDNYSLVSESINSTIGVQKHLASMNVKFAMNLLHAKRYDHKARRHLRLPLLLSRWLAFRLPRRFRAVI